MKKKILFVMLCLLSLTYINGVSARACTQNDIESARATISFQESSYLPIPSLGRTKETGKAYFYKMNLIVKGSGQTSFCLASGKSAGKEYKIDHEVVSPRWKSIYHYGMTYKNDEIKFAIAQAAFWMLTSDNENYKLTNLNGIDKTNLRNVVKDIILNKNCEKYAIDAGKTPSEATSICNNYKDSTNSTVRIESFLTSANYGSGGIASGIQFISNLSKQIETEVEYFANYDVEYNGKLYYWVESNGNTNSQPMLAPLICGDNNYSCVDKNGKVHDYTDEYNACVRAGGGQSDCRAQFENKYCSNSTTGIIKTTGSNAVCTNYYTNYGSYNEYVDTTVSGNAIDGIGEPEKQITQYCNLFCLENSAQQIFPGNIKSAVSVGTYVIWPTSEATLSSSYKNNYPLKFSGQKTCYVVMAGEDNTVNKTDINKVLTGLNSEAISANKYDGEFADKYYEISRRNGGCESIYSNTNGVCKKSYDAMVEAENYWRSYESSQEYINAKNEEAKVNNYNANIPSCPQGVDCSDESIKYYCTNSSTNIASISCPIIHSQCDACRGERMQLDPKYVAIINERNNRYNTYMQKKAVYDRCAAQRSSCNDYTNKVQAMVNFANEVKSCATYTPSCSGGSCDMYNFETNVDLSWGDPEYGTTIYDSQLEKTKNYSYSINGNSNVSVVVDMSQGRADINTNASRLITEVSNIVKNRSIKANVSVTYSLPTKDNLLYNYIVTRNNVIISQTAKPSSDSNYKTVGFSNLPVSFNSIVGSDYNLILSNIRFGDNGGQYKPDNYTCSYEVVNTPPSNCACPTGTYYSGKDLSEIIKLTNLTCYEAQKAYCDTSHNRCPDGSKEDIITNCMQNEFEDDYFACIDKYCDKPDSSNYCPDKPWIKLDACIQTYGRDYCIKTLCEDEYTCINSDKKITSCVNIKMLNGLSLNDAIIECDALLCHDSGGSGIRIIYRTISLENPFPGKNISNKVNGFNDDVKGRYPGANWNDVKLVNEHILTVKRQGIKYDGSAIYQGEPLYTFVLTTSTINAIRNYNEGQEINGGYADYTLDCKKNNSVACVSDFVHNPDLSGLVSGVCMNSTSSSNFYVCSGDN